jgi:MerR family transcriptional regulator, redox-sensitive transcriptional activator SoxR
LKSRPKPGLLIGEFAKMAGIRPSAVRYYESVGLLPSPMRQGRWRVYSASALERLKTLIAARHLGFSIGDLKRLVQAEPAELRATARDRADEIRRSMATMGGAADRLEALTACQCISEADCVFFVGI